MNQLKYDDSFHEIVEDVSFWKDIEDIPNSVISFLKSSLSQNIIFNTETGNFHCPECMAELDEHHYCSKCYISYEDFINKEYEYIDGLKKENRFNLDYPRYVFDSKNNNVILYKIRVHVNCYYTIYLSKIYKTYRFEIENAYFIEKEKVTDLVTNTTYDLNEYYKKYLENDCDINLEFGNVYVENLEELKNTEYQYSYLWNAKEFLRKKEVSFNQLIFLPIYFSQFEYLMKESLFSLAFFSPNIFEKNKKFQELFGVEKKYIPFIRENDISFHELELLKVYPTDDIKLIRYFTKNEFYDGTFVATNISHFKIDLKHLKEYFDKNHLEDYLLIEYFDYLRMAETLNLDLTNKDTLYPNDLLDAHDNLFLQIKMVENPDIDKKIKNLASMLSINNYEDENYVIYPADSVEALMKEGLEQHNCVRTYCEKVANNDSQIYFMRKKSNLKKAYVTIEVFENTIIQARVKYNEQPNDEVKAILKKWETNLIPIMNQ